MEDAKMRILKMLEEGKISAEEAIRLLESLEQAQKKETTRTAKETTEEQESLGFDKFFSSIGEMVAGIMKSIPKMAQRGIEIPYSSQRRIIDASNVERITVKVMGGDITVRTSDDKKIFVSNISFPGTVKRVNKKVFAKCMGGDVDLTVPNDVPLVVKVMGGDAEIRDLEQDATIAVQGGDATLYVKTPKRIESKLQGGDLTVYLSKDAQLKVYAEVDEDSSELIFSGELSEKVVEEHPGVYRIGDNPAGEIHIRIVGGTAVFQIE